MRDLSVIYRPVHSLPQLFNQSLLNCAPSSLCPSLIRTLLLRTLPITNTRLTRLCAFTLTNKRFTCLCLALCQVVSIVRYDLRLKNPRKATGPDFIPLKLIKFASNVVGSHLYNIIIKDLEKNMYSEQPKTALELSLRKMKETKKEIPASNSSKYCKWNV